MDEIGRAGWFGIGVTTMALAGAAHAVAGTGHILREMTRTSADENRVPAAGGSDLQVDSGPGGWVLFGALVLAGGSIYHVLAGTGTIAKEIVHAGEAVTGP
ncbi:hypothetical protein [Kitasatospora camelliae]|uniref:Uncharacterized protein n=1 Tax=Kitasatospora camelliae TaxID=3156397 RepID=A0AAU8KAC9_9ACTN